MTKLFLTYAWKDNEAEQVDFVIGELRKQGLEVIFDRAHLVPGQRLWAQIDKAISDQATSHAWAIYVTENSLRSEPCQEELAIALDRALRTRGPTYPLIGIFPAPIDRSLIPSAIATRRWVDLRSQNWALQVAAGARGGGPEVSLNAAPYVTALHKDNGRDVLEVRPRAGRWYPFWILVPEAEFDCVSTIVPGPSGHPTGAGMVSRNEMTLEDRQTGDVWKGYQLHHAIDPLTSAYVYFNRSPSRLMFGQANGEVYRFPN